MTDTAPPVPNPTSSPNVSPPISIPQGTPQVNPNIPPVPATLQPKKSPVFIIVLVIILLAVIGGASFFVASLLNKPAKIREAVNTTQPFVESLETTNKKIIEHIKDDMGTDPDAIDRYTQKGDNYISTETSDLESLTNLTNKMPSGDLKTYKDSLLKFINATNQLLSIEKDNTRLGKLYKSPISDYKALAVSISGASTYLYSDTAKYLAILTDATQKEQAIIKTFQSIQPGSVFKEKQDVAITNFQDETDFLNKMTTAVTNRSASQIVDAQKSYAQNLQSLQTQASKADDTFNNSLETIGDNAENEYKNVTSQIDTFKRKYNF